MTKKLLILYATGGAGHTQAAKALHEAAIDSGLPLSTAVHDCLDLTSTAFKRFYADSYLTMVNRAPELWGYLYSRAEVKPYEKRGLLKLFDSLNYRKYFAFLLSERPDAILCTHFLPYLSVSARLQRSTLTAPVFAATTDFDAHQYWIDPIVHRYYVHTEESAWQLTAKGVDETKIRVKGIPVGKRFASREDQLPVRRRLGLPPHQLTFLMIWGGFGVGKAEEMVTEVMRTLGACADRRFTVITVCGRNERLRSRVETLTPPANVDRRVIGFADNVHELMSASDVLISKAGGLTSAESMAMGLPMIIVDPIPGQETRNAEMIIERRAGWKAMNIANLGYKVKRIAESPALLEEARNATAALSRPRAAAEIIHDVYHTVTQGAPS